MLAFLGFVAVVVGLISLIRPIHWLGIRSRRSAAWVLAAGLAAMVVGGGGADDGPPAAPEVTQGPATTPQEGAPAEAQPEAADEATSGGEEPGEQASAEQEEPPSEPAQPAEEAAQAPGPAQEDDAEAVLRAGITQATVTNVVDGDTIDVEYVAGAALPDARIRFIGVDTPEVHGRTDPYGAEASAFTKERLTGNTVWLEKDVSETDRYGRALRYVWLTEPPAEPTEDDARKHMFNALLVLGGYAQASTYPPDVKYADLFAKFQAEAREADKGLWGLGDQEAAGEASEPAGEEAGAGQAPPSGQGQNCDPSYPDVCIPPPPPDLDCGDIEHRRFRVLPPDPHGFGGRDQDGIGCES